MVDLQTKGFSAVLRMHWFVLPYSYNSGQSRVLSVNSNCGGIVPLVQGKDFEYPVSKQRLAREENGTRSNSIDKSKHVPRGICGFKGNSCFISQLLLS